MTTPPANTRPSSSAPLSRHNATAALYLHLKGRLRCRGVPEEGAGGEGWRRWNTPFSAPPQRRHIVTSTMRVLRLRNRP